VVDAASEPSVGRGASLLANIPAAIALERAYLAGLRGDAEHIDAFGQQALAHLTEDDRTLRSTVDWHLAVADWQRGRVVQAKHGLAGVVAEQRAAGEGYLAVRSAYDLGQVQRALGHLGAALRTYQQALEIANQIGCPVPLAGIVRRTPPSGRTRRSWSVATPRPTGLRWPRRCGGWPPATRVWWCSTGLGWPRPARPSGRHRAGQT
jgi:hypothetical protein